MLAPSATGYPEDSDWSFTRYFFPEGLAKGEHLEKESKRLYNLFIEIRKEHGVSTEFELPMEYLHIPLKMH